MAWLRTVSVVAPRMPVWRRGSRPRYGEPRVSDHRPELSCGRCWQREKESADDQETRTGHYGVHGVGRPGGDREDRTLAELASEYGGRIAAWKKEAKESAVDVFAGTRELLNEESV